MSETFSGVLVMAGAAAVAVLLTALAGALVYRIRGQADSGLPRPCWQAIFALPYGIAAWSATGLWWAGLAAWVLTTGAVSTGHASYMDLGYQPVPPADGDDDEWYGRWLPGTGYWHDYAGLMVSGLLITLPAAIACYSPVLALTGIMKAPAYGFGWLRGGKLILGLEPTDMSELLTGAYLWGTLMIIFMEGLR